MYKTHLMKQQMYVMAKLLPSSRKLLPPPGNEGHQLNMYPEV